MSEIKPLGKEATKAALLDAADELFGEKGPNSVTVRDISAAANVNHALLHRHFGSKEAVLSAIIDRHRMTFKQDIREAADIEETVSNVFSGMINRPAFARTFAHLLLDHRPVEEFVSQAGGTADVAVRLVEAGVEEEEARRLSAILNSFSMGWTLFRSLSTYAANCSSTMEEMDEFACRAIQNIVTDIVEKAAK